MQVRDTVELTLVQKIILKFNRRVFIGNRMNPGWNDSLPFYAFECDEHGLVEDYPHGYERRLECPKCALSSNNART